MPGGSRRTVQRQCIAVAGTLPIRAARRTVCSFSHPATRLSCAGNLDSDWGLCRCFAIQLQLVAVPNDFQLFSTMAALSERILSVGEGVSPFINKLDFTNAAALQYKILKVRVGTQSSRCTHVHSNAPNLHTCFGLQCRTRKAPALRVWQCARLCWPPARDSEGTRTCGDAYACLAYC